MTTAITPGADAYDILANFQGPFSIHPVVARALKVPGNRLRLRGNKRVVDAVPGVAEQLLGGQRKDEAAVEQIERLTNDRQLVV